MNHEILSEGEREKMIVEDEERWEHERQEKKKKTLNC